MEEAREAGRVPAQRAEVHLERAAVEYADDHGLAEAGGHDREAEVHAAAAQGGRGPAVLRPAVLGDVHAADHLDAGADRLDGPVGQHQHLTEHAVDAEAHAHALGLGLHVDVGGAAFDGVDEEEVDELDIGAAALLELAHDGGGVELQGGRGDHRRAELRGHVGQHALGLRLEVVVAVDGAGEPAGSAHLGVHRAAEGELEVPDGSLIARVGHHHLEAARHPGVGERPVLLRQPPRELPHRGAVHRDGQRIHPGHPELPPDGLGQRDVVDGSGVEEHLADALAGVGLLLAEHVGDLAFADVPFFDQDLAELLPATHELAPSIANRTEKRAPAPSSEVTPMTPPCASTNCRTM